MRTASWISAAALLLACGTTAPMTSWPYSSWNAKYGAGSLGGFKDARRGCLEQLGIADPEGVAHDSSTENGFIICMNEAGWCSNAYGCEKPGAS